MSPGEYRGFIRFFQSYATNNMLNKHNLRSVLFKYNIKPTNDELQQMIDCISVNTVGINLQGFIDYMSTWAGFRDQEQEYAECFRVYDRSGMGKLTREDIKYVMAKLGNDKMDIDQLMDMYSKDGVIAYDEFVQMMKKY